MRRPRLHGALGPRTFPRTTPRLETPQFSPRHAAPCHRVVRAPCTRRTAGPSAVRLYARRTRSAVARRYLRRHHDVTGAPLYLRSPAFPPRARPPLPPLHYACHGRRLAIRRLARPLGYRAREHLPRDL
jgi:hypothetical protein